MRSSDPTPDPRRLLTFLVDSLRLAALPADRQIEALPDFVHVPDEVALVFDDAWALMPQLEEAGLVSPEQRRAIEPLSDLYDEMSIAGDRESLWTIEAMRSDARWDRSRERAREALDRLGESQGQPTFEGVVWVPGRSVGEA